MLLCIFVIRGVKSQILKYNFVYFEFGKKVLGFNILIFLKINSKADYKICLISVKFLHAANSSLDM